MSLLDDLRFELFKLPFEIKKNYTEEDKVYDVLSFQLKKILKSLNINNIEIYSPTIQGNKLESENIIIDIDEDNAGPIYVGKGKNRRRMKRTSIIPSLPYTQENI